MKLGAMNSPDKDAIKEIKLFGEMGFDFVDLAIEGPRAHPEALSRTIKEIRDLLSSNEMFAVAHVPWYFDIGHPYASVRKVFLEEARKAIEAASKFEIQKVGLHILKPRGLFEDKLGRNISGIKEIVKEAEKHGMVVCVENLDLPTFSVEDFKRVFEEVPEAKLLYDIGHANLGIREEDEIFLFLDKFKERVSHVHAHDNMGGEDDLHLPIGAGDIDWKKVTKKLKKVYNGTITLEIHAQDRDYLKMSKEKFLRYWK